MAPTASRPASRARRWLFAVAVLAVVLAGYAVGLRWLSDTLGGDVARSMRAEPVIDDSRHRRD